MRMVAMIALLGSAYAGEAEWGEWRMNPSRSTFGGDVRPKGLTVWIEPHPKGEVLTVDRIEVDGRTTSSSTILYLDGIAKDFQDFTCSGTQSSRRISDQSVEIKRKCSTGESIWLIRPPAGAAKELTIQSTERRNGLPLVEWRAVLQKQSIFHP
jgi:hypothetical protein